MEWLEIIKQSLIGILGGLSISAILTAIILGCIKGIGEKISKKINVEKITENAVEKGIDKVKSISYTQTVQPVLESGLEKVNEKSAEFINKKYDELKQDYRNIVDILKSLASYFDDAFGVPDHKKEKLHQAIEKAENKVVEPQVIKVQEEHIEQPKQADNNQKETKAIR